MINAAAGGNLGDLGQLVSVAAPIIVAAIGGLFGYRQAVKVADRTSSVEGRKLTLAEYEALNRGLQEEINRMRADRVEDEERFEKRLAAVDARIERLEADRTAANESLALMIGWGRMVLATLRRPEVADALNRLGVTVPNPPELRGATGQQIFLWNVRSPDG